MKSIEKYKKNNFKKRTKEKLKEKSECNSNKNDVSMETNKISILIHEIKYQRQQKKKRSNLSKDDEYNIKIRKE